MGCVETQHSTAESTLLSKSKNTRFELSFPDSIIETIRRYALDSSGIVNLRQLAKIQDKLMLKTGEGELRKFYEKATRVQDLTIAGVLLSMGSPREKAVALFEIRDEQSLNVLTTQEVEQLIEAVYAVCLDVLPLLATLDDNDLKYLAKVRANADRAVPSFRQIAMGSAEKIDKATFTKNLENYMEGKLTDPSGIREFACSAEKSKK